MARFNRADGREVYFLTGTDEHGQKVEQSAVAAGKSPLQFADEVSAQFRRLVEVRDTLHARPPARMRTCVPVATASLAYLALPCLSPCRALHLRRHPVGRSVDRCAEPFLAPLPHTAAGPL